MRVVFSFGRLCFRSGCPRFNGFLRQRRSSPFSQWRLPLRSSASLPKGGKHTLLAALTPAAFVRLSEEDIDDGKSPEEHMLEASRAEIQKHVPDNIHGLRRAWQGLLLVLDNCIYEPIATGLRFLHLVIIFVPVLLATPAIWLGNRVKERDNERTGTLWWYGFLVHSMERAGPAFIKVIT